MNVSARQNLSENIYWITDINSAEYYFYLNYPVESMLAEFECLVLAETAEKPDDRWLGEVVQASELRFPSLLQNATGARRRRHAILPHFRCESSTDWISHLGF